MTDISHGYVRTEMLSEEEPPKSEVGFIGWARENLFSSVLNSILTIAALLAVFFLLAELLPWIFKSSWTAKSLNECREAISVVYGEGVSGACWAVIRDRYLQLIYGFYPQEMYWRQNLSFVLMLVALSPILFTALPRKMLWFSVAFPLIGYLLLWGGSIWSPLMVLAGPVVGYVAMTYLSRVTGSLVGIIAAALVTILWWMFAVSAIDSMLTNAIANSRMESTAARMERVIAAEFSTDEQVSDAQDLLAQIQGLPEKEAEIVALDAEVENLRGALPSSVAGLDSIDDVPSGTSGDDKKALEEVLKTEQMAEAAKKSVRTFKGDLGRIGLEPVKSSLFGGFMLSIIIGLTGIVASLPLGILLALGRQSNLLIVKSICVGFIEFIRGVPLITLLFVASVLLNYFLPPGTSFDLILRVVIMVTLFSSAYIAEVIRGGLAALPRGQYEAADALGLDYWKATRLIVMPQALKISIPGIVSSFIGLFKDTTLVSIIGLLDPIGLSNAIRANQEWNGIIWELYGFIAFMFWIFCFSMSRYSMYLERKLQTGH